MITGLDLLRNQPIHCTTGIDKLDGDGFDEGIYDISGSIGYGSIGVYEIIIELMISKLGNDGKVLFIESYNKFPWFKLEMNKRYDKRFANMVDCISIDNLMELIILMKNNDRLLDNYNMIIIDSFNLMYEGFIEELRGEKSKYEQCVHLLFYQMNKLCGNGKIMFTIGGMSSISQRVYKEEEEDDDDEEGEESIEGENIVNRYIKQDILVPTISLNNKLNIYYKRRIIIYRDWIYDDGKLSNCEYILFERDVIRLNEGKIKCVPHYISIGEGSSVCGFFLISKTFELIDIEGGVDVDDYEMTDNDMDVEIPDSQEY